MTVLFAETLTAGIAEFGKETCGTAETEGMTLSEGETVVGVSDTAAGRGAAEEAAPAFDAKVCPSAEEGARLRDPASQRTARRLSAPRRILVSMVIV